MSKTLPRKMIAVPVDTDTWEKFKTRLKVEGMGSVGEVLGGVIKRIAEGYEQKENTNTVAWIKMIKQKDGMWRVVTP